MSRKEYRSDVRDEEWALVAPYLTLMAADTLPCGYPLRAVYHGLRWMVHACFTSVRSGAA
jgi:hypothetical protein